MEKNKRTIKVKNGILIAVVIAFLIAIIGGTYSRFVSRGTARSSTDIAKWHIVLGAENISSQSKSVTVPVQDVENNGNVAEGKLAPGKTVVATFNVDPTGSEVAVDYLLNVDLSNVSEFDNSELEISNLKYIVEGTNTEEEMFLDETTGDYLFEEELDDVLAGKDVTFKIYITWTPSTDLARSLADTQKAVNIDNILIPINIVARQHIGDSLTKYTVTFKDGETTLSTQTVEEGQTATKPADPTKEEYDFVNWYSDSELTNLYDFTSTITGNITIYAKWEETASTSARSLISPQPTGTTYEAGDEVTFKGENFFVVADDGTSVRLLAKYCLLRDASAQGTKDTTYYGSGTAGYGRSFSGSDYWSSDFTSSPFELQTTAMLAKIPSTDTAENNAIKAAQSYGQAKGVTGRLMTKAEADSMRSSNSAIMYGKWTDGTQPTEGYLYWWLGAATGTSNVWNVNGKYSALSNNDCSSTIFGVRPVLEVSES